MTNAIQLDNGNETVTITRDAIDARGIMLRTASDIAVAVVNAEKTIGETAKSWGHALFRAVHVDKVAALDSLIGDSKVAAGWTTLTLSDAGKKAKGRLEVYFSNARLVAEKWDGMEESQREAVLNGESSIHYLADQFRKAEKAAKKEAQAAAEKAQAAAETTSQPQGESQPETVAFNPVDAMELLTLSFDEMDASQMAAIGDAFNAMVAAYDARLNALVGDEAKAA